MSSLSLRSSLLKSWILILSILLLASNTQAQNVTIGYQAMPVPMKLLVGNSQLPKETGYDVQWKPFATGNDIAEALKNGEIQIGEIGSSPLVAALTSGTPLELFWINDDIAQSEALVVRNDSNIENFRDLAGKKIATVNLSTAHFQLFALIAEASLRPKAELVFMPPAEIANAWENGEIDAAFIWNPVLNKLKSSGTVLLDAKIASEQGYKTFDGMAVSSDWAAQNPSFMTAFVKLLERSHQLYHDNSARWSSDSAPVKHIAKVTQMPPQQVLSAMSLYRFPPAQEQLSGQWLRKSVPKAMAYTAIFQSLMDPSKKKLNDYKPFINTSFLESSLENIDN